MKEIEYKEVEWKERTNKGYEVTVAPSGATVYTLDGEFHREDGPAAIHPDGSKAWYLNGECHREDGPAIIRPDGYKAWFLNGKRVSKKDFTIEMIKQLNASELFTIQELAKLRLENG